jgi:WD repeat-containing protein 23
LVDRYRNTVFCAEYSPDGEMFVTASQDKMIRIYNANTWKLAKSIRTRDMGWAVLCTDFSPNTQWVAYSGWDTHVHLVNTSGDHEVHEALDVVSNTRGRSRVALFSVKFSADSREILAGSKDNHFYLYDVETKRTTHAVEAHSDDINNVAWADEACNVFFTGSDDHLIKVWDRRIIRNDNKPAGVLPGHLHGITYIDSRGDGRYLISNGKDQRIKLWDLRVMASGDSEANDPPNRLFGMMDYRMGIPGQRYLHRRLDNDVSIMTYRGHQVAETLIRCKFSPLASTGQRFIYTGSHGGEVFVFDVLTGEIEARLQGHASTVRDLDWHPLRQSLVTTGWDGRVIEWNWSPSHALAGAEAQMDDFDDDDAGGPNHYADDSD